VTGRSERARFDNAYAAEGFDFSEESIGTNGLGTALREGSAVFVRGPEHFNDALEELACARTGIRHPATGRLIGLNVEMHARLRDALLSQDWEHGPHVLDVAREWLRSEGQGSPLVLDAGELGSSWRREVTAALASGGAVVLRRLEDIAASQVNAVKAVAESLAAARADRSGGKPCTGVR
jgi:hypothetical protein